MELKKTLPLALGDGAQQFDADDIKQPFLLPGADTEQEEGTEQTHENEGRCLVEDDFNFEPPPRRSDVEMLAAHQELCDKIWYADWFDGRFLIWKDGKFEAPTELSKEIIEGGKQIRQKYPKEKQAPLTDYEYGMLCGKLSALRWAWGSEWDDLDI